MRTYEVVLEFSGLTGNYKSVVAVRARNRASAEKKSLRVAGDRCLVGIVTVFELSPDATIVGVPVIS